jgi:hypothetical protein
MENVHLSVIPAKAGIHWLQGLRDPCLRRDDGEEAFFDTRERGNPGDGMGGKASWKWQSS